MNARALDGLRVLIVEDETLISMLMEVYLEQLGCSVVGSASRLDEAVEMAGRLEMDAAVLDVNLAGKMSYPVAEVLRARGVPFVFATGYGLGGLPDRMHGVPGAEAVQTRPHRASVVQRGAGVISPRCRVDGAAQHG